MSLSDFSIFLHLQPSKVDLQLESGEYFLNQHTRRKREAAVKREAQAEKVDERQRQRQAAFVPPEVNM